MPVERVRKSPDGRNSGRLTRGIEAVEAAGNRVLQVVETVDAWVLLTESGKDRIERATAPVVETRASDIA